MEPTHILCDECKNEFEYIRPAMNPETTPQDSHSIRKGEIVQCPVCGTTLSIIAVTVHEDGGVFAKTKPVLEEK